MRAAVLAAVLLVSACSSSPPLTDPAEPLPSGATAPPAASPTPSVVVSERPVIEAIDAAGLGATWRPGCPVAPKDLRRVNLSYLGTDGQPHRGAIVVHRAVVDDVASIFDELFRLGYPIEKMRPVDQYPGAEDELSMQDNNTSAFNCRPLRSGSWSLHAYGRAIDINPLVNPYIDKSGDLQPSTARKYLDRNRSDPGMIRDGDAVVQAFTKHGWKWGGRWRDPIDYQHFELPLN